MDTEREKGWLTQVLNEASERVENWPDWKKSPDLSSQGRKQQCSSNVSGNQPEEPSK